jgi:hypothetical protein
LALSWRRMVSGLPTSSWPLPCMAYCVHELYTDSQQLTSSFVGFGKATGAEGGALEEDEVTMDVTHLEDSAGEGMPCAMWDDWSQCPLLYPFIHTSACLS